MNVRRLLTGIDRRVIYLALLFVIVGAFYVPLDLPIRPAKNALAVHERIQALKGTGRPILLSFDFDPGSEAELAPQARAVLHDAFDAKVPVVAMTLLQNGQDVARGVLNDVAAARGAVEGKDYVLLGYKPGTTTVILSMGQDFRDAFSADVNGRPTAELAPTRDVRKLADFGYVMSFTSTGAWESWMIFGHERYRFPLGLGLTGVLAPDTFPFIATGQIQGMLAGLGGAAEYEAIVSRPDAATRGMRPQSAGHLLIALFVIVANAVYLTDPALRAKKR